MSYYGLMLLSVSQTAMSANIIAGDITFLAHDLYGVIGIPLAPNQLKTRHQDIFVVVGAMPLQNTLRVKHQTLYAVVEI